MITFFNCFEFFCLFVFDKSVNMILEVECLDFKYEFCIGAATQDIGGLGNSKILDTTKAEVWKNNVVCFVWRDFYL